MKVGEFLKLMGKGKRCWKYVQTKQDRLDLKEFEDLFVKNFREGSESDEILIPEILHFIWLGPKEYPERSRKYLQGWIEYHPGWRVIVWSDQERKFLPQGVEQKMCDASLLKEYLPLYEGTDNFGERSDIVRLLVLDEMGGVYVDHDMECRRSFAAFHKLYPFYGGLLTPGNPVVHRSAIVRNSIVGAKKGHSILKKALQTMQERWQEVGEKYPGNDTNSIKKRVTLRSFIAFHEAVLEALRGVHFEGIIFPAGCFNEIEKEFGIYAKEDMVGAWYTAEMTHHEEYLKNRIHRLMKKVHWMGAIFAIAWLVLLVFVVLLWIKLL